MEVVRRLRSILTQGEIRLVLGVLVLAVVTGVLQTLAVFSIMPFMALVTDPASPTATALSGIGATVGLAPGRELLLGAGAAVLLLVLAANTLGALSLRRVQLAAWNIHHSLSQRLLTFYLGLPYPWFLERHSSRLGQNLLQEVGMVVQVALGPLLRAAVRGVEALLIVGLLLFLDPGLTLASGGAIGVAYLLVYVVVRKAQERLGQLRARTDERRFRVASEALVGIKEIKALGAEAEFIRRFGDTGPDFVRSKAWSEVVAELPRYLLEVLSMGTVLVVFLVLLLAGNDVNDLLPKLVVFGFAGYKLVPSLHQVFTALSRTRFALDAVRTIDEHLTESINAGYAPDAGVAMIGFERSFELEAVTFRYANAERAALDDVSLTIRKGELVGVVGPTGSGKTTLVDVLLGLLAPDTGEARIDGESVDMGALGRAWRAGVGYVPQTIFLADDSIAQNIAFGVAESQIDMERVLRVARMAEVHEFVTELAGGYETLVGDRGIRLSGGQRQRIGLARALYRDPALLVLDEATSALDGGTEEAVMDAIYGLEPERTVVVVAHRLQTVRRCDRILLLDRGRLVAEGTFDELWEANDLFRVMARGVAL